ncbi:MAG TPA: cytochrome ubiquinol oxidase subunit I [Candidatus Dormibacteraeota bacterium]|nr:cytochrome ubiquinol oxidase subunit I [Candidatus Dormibacteraeota bacterium]
MDASVWLAADSALLPSRIQMAFTLATHVLLVPLGVAFPALTLVMEGIGIFRKDPIALRIARRWSVVMAVQFAVGAVTGTILSFEFGILWPRMMGAFGAAMGMGFAIEGLAFFLEAIFIGIYLYGWKALSPRVHFLTGLALPPVGLLGAVSVLSANAFMQTPSGVTISAGRVVNVDALAALTPRALGYEFWQRSGAGWFRCEGISSPRLRTGAATPSPPNDHLHRLAPPPSRGCRARPPCVARRNRCPRF